MHGSEPNLVSVLLPLRNVAPWLEPCLRSLQRQSHESFEVLAIDDGSTDATAEIYGRVARGDSRFRLTPARGKGLVDALNQAAQLASADWLARMDGDDLCHWRRFELQLRLAQERPELAVIGSLVRIFPAPLSKGMSRYERWLNSVQTPEQIEAQLFVESPLAHPTVLMRRAEFEAVGGYVDRGWPEDYDLWLRFAAAGCRIAKVDRALLLWRDHSTRTSRTQPQYSPEAFRECKLEHLRRAYPLDRGCAILGAGPTGKPWAQLLRRAGLPLRCFVEVHPRRVGKTIAGAPVIGYDALPRLGPCVLLAAVGREGAREEVLRHFREHPPAAGQQLVLVA